MADKNLTTKDMSMVFEETCLTVKDVKKIIRKTSRRYDCCE